MPFPELFECWGNLLGERRDNERLTEKGAKAERFRGTEGFESLSFLKVYPFVSS